MTCHRARLVPLLVLLPFGISMTPDARAQEAGGLHAHLTIGQQLDYENQTGQSNVNDEGFATRTDLGVSLHSTTRTQSLRFSAKTGLRYEINDNGLGKRFKLEDPNLALSYAIESRATRLRFENSYRRVDVDEAVFEDEISGDGVVTGGGNRANSKIGAALELGRAAPFGAKLSYSLAKTRYSNTTDPSLVNLDTQRYAASLRFDLSPQLQLTPFATLNDRDAASPGSSDRRAAQYGVQAAYQLSPRTRATGRLFHTSLNTDDNAGTTTNTGGLGYDLGLTHALTNGEITAQATQRETVNGAARELIFGRNLTFQRGTLGLTLGVSKTDGLEAEPLVGLALGLDLDPLSQLTVDLTQRITVDDDNDSALNTRLSVRYARSLSEVASLQAALTLVDRAEQTPGASDQRATQISLTHQYQLGDDLSLMSGYTHSATRRDTGTDTTQDRLFIGVERSFNFRP